MKTNRIAAWILAGATLLVAIAAAQAAPSHQLRLRAEIDKPYLLYGENEKAYLRVGLTGIPIRRPEQRPPVNVALVIDKSGSMGGQKIVQAREAAIMAVRRLDARDTVSIVTYDTTVDVVVPAMPVGDTDWIVSRIRRIEPGGNTALFAGVSKGADQLRKYLSPHRVNRVVLISDGLANVGPSSPRELGRLGESLVREGISVSTIGLGLGYNEDLMYRLAERSDGNHYFAQEPHELVAAFDREFGETLAVVAQEIRVEITVLPPFRPVRILGRDGHVRGQIVECYLNQVYGDREKFVLVEVDVPDWKKIRPPVDHDKVRENPIARVDVRYDNMKTRSSDRLSDSVKVRFTRSPKLIEANRNAMVAAEAVKVIAAERTEEALSLREQGRKEEAKQVLHRNAQMLRSSASELNAPALGELSVQQSEAVRDMDANGVQWQARRKAMKVQQLEMQRNSIQDNAKVRGK